MRREEAYGITGILSFRTARWALKKMGISNHKIRYALSIMASQLITLTLWTMAGVWGLRLWN